MAEIRLLFELLTGLARAALVLALVVPLFAVMAPVYLVVEVCERIVTKEDQHSVGMARQAGLMLRGVAVFGWTVGGLYPLSTDSASNRAP